MAGNKAGGLKASITNKKRHGADFYNRIGRKGGSVSTPNGGFGSSTELARRAGSAGGKNGRIGYKLIEKRADGVLVYIERKTGDKFTLDPDEDFMRKVA